MKIKDDDCCFSWPIISTENDSFFQQKSEISTIWRRTIGPQTHFPSSKWVQGKIYTELAWTIHGSWSSIWRCLDPVRDGRTRVAKANQLTCCQQILCLNINFSLIYFLLIISFAYNYFCLAFIFLYKLHLTWILKNDICRRPMTASVTVLSFFIFSCIWTTFNLNSQEWDT